MGHCAWRWVRGGALCVEVGEGWGIVHAGLGCADYSCIDGEEDGEKEGSVFFVFRSPLFLIHSPLPVVPAVQ